MKTVKCLLKTTVRGFSFKLFKFLTPGILCIIMTAGSCSRQVVELKQYFEHIPVLCYHHINPAEALHDNYINTVPDEFEKQIEFLHSYGYKTILSKNVSNVLAPAEKNVLGENNKPIMITFDDGYRSVYDHAYPVMKKYGYKGIIFLITDRIEKDWNRMFMNREQINELIKEGWEIGSHTITHPKLNQISMEEATNEIIASKKTLEDMFGVKVISFAYPYGLFNKKVIDTVKDNYTYAFSTIYGNNHGFKDTHLMERYLVLKADEFANFKTNVTSKTLKCRINSELFNNVLYVDVTLPEKAEDRPLQVYFNSRLIKDLPSIETEDIHFKFNYYHEYNNFTIVMKETAGIQCSVTKMIHVCKSADVY
ncbi:MAG: polysaccharide deacetylase family protein [Spirochaetes bacterium]|nr:polysaccharide deacetylase family protein [Spirochaetota bacterium]